MALSLRMSGVVDVLIDHVLANNTQRLELDVRQLAPRQLASLNVEEEVRAYVVSVNRSEHPNSVASSILQVAAKERDRREASEERRRRNREAFERDKAMRAAEAAIAANEVTTAQSNETFGIF
ncbi:hypothetical protein [Aureimonas sp. AU40]|uniref:hypothetical protein n=1 Tax=Aureimonas sp. AU40 TaxID=1637747 RepID=UPI0007814DB4|nr:hypothetical protein [Aureimonas sp. AU40]